MLVASRDTARQKFNAMRSLPSESDEAKAEIARAEEVAKILRRNIVQGEKVNQSEEEDRYRKSFPFLPMGCFWCRWEI